MRSLRPASLILLFSLGWCLLAGAEGSGFRVLKKLQLGGEGGWDTLTVDPAARRLYIARGTHVMVLDLNTDRVIGDIPDTPGVHGVALVPELGQGFTSNGKDDSVSIFDLGTLAVLGKVKTGANPDAILFDPASKRVFAFNGASHDVTVLDPTSRTVTGSIVLGGEPEGAVTDGKGRIYVALEDQNQVLELDTRNLTVLRRFALGLGKRPAGLGWDPRQRRLFVGCRNQVLAILDADTGQMLASLPIGAGVDGTLFDPETQRVYSPNGWDATLTVVRETAPAQYEVVETIPTQHGARTLTLDPKAQLLYLPTAQFGPLPPAIPGEHHRRPPVIQNSFMLLVVGK